jgi:hypothetical protein
MTVGCLVVDGFGWVWSGWDECTETEASQQL